MERCKALLLNTLDESDISRVIEMAWEDRTPFEAIEAQFGLNQGGVIKLMRSRLKLMFQTLARAHAWAEYQASQTQKSCGDAA